MKSLLHIQTDGNTTIVSGNVNSKDELLTLGVALANLFYEEAQLCDIVVESLNELEAQNKESQAIEIDIDSITSKQVKS
jgi:hypothetical protein